MTPPAEIKMLMKNYSLSNSAEHPVDTVVVAHWCDASAEDDNRTKVGPRNIPERCSTLLIALHRTRNVVISHYHRTKPGDHTKAYRTTAVACDHDSVHLLSESVLTLSKK